MFLVDVQVELFLVDVQVSRISHHELHFLNTIAAVYLCLGYTVALLQNAPFVRCTAMSHLFVHEFEQIASDENMSGHIDAPNLIYALHVL